MRLKQTLGMSVTVAALGLTLLIGGSYAYFSDSEEVYANSTTGILEMNVDDAPEDATFEFGNLKPGDVRNINFTLTNDGTLDIQDLFLDVTNSDSRLSKYLKVNEFTLGSDNQFLINRIKDVNGNGFIDLDDLARISREDPIKLRGSFYLAAPRKDVHIQVELHDNGEEQNYLQDRTNNMTLNLKAVQSFQQ